ncbi:hypothetical protein E6O75_ATG05159 [Venturia nashicola]|uniref:CFEM domain-containing protein n=1 Tax=Venturia nashicola TaxID=86259 RepID=A0A4Z1P5D8_9PEZI|nr:hypothetical protein E6O75_ATG05159 [Venturia nashicola]
MKTSTIIGLFVGLVSASQLGKRSCSTQCVEKVVQASGCDANDVSCSCSKPGMIKQLQPCLEFACGTTALDAAKVAFVQKCQAAGVHVEFGEDHVPPGHHEMVRRDSVADDASSAGARASRTTGGGRQAARLNGAATSREFAGSMLGLVAAVAAAAAI